MNFESSNQDTMLQGRFMQMLSALRDLMSRNTSLTIGMVVLLAMVAIAIFAPWLGTTDPTAISPIHRLKGPSAEHWFGTDALGRDVFSRTLYGARISLIVGFSVAILSITLGLFFGLLSGFVRYADGIIMRFIDGLMSIPSIMFAIALVAVVGTSVVNVIIAITLAEVPRATRLVRGIVFSLRDQLFVEAARVSGIGQMRLLMRHIVPNTVAPLTVQASFIAAAAMIIEAVLSFVGAGLPPSVPSWGGMMADGRAFFRIAEHAILFPGLFLSITILAVNLIGDGLREVLDPRLST